MTGDSSNVACLIATNARPQMTLRTVRVEYAAATLRTLEADVSVVLLELGDAMIIPRGSVGLAENGDIELV